MHKLSYEPSVKRNPISKQQSKDRNTRIDAGEERSESFSDSQTNSMDYTDIDDDIAHDYIHNTNFYIDEADQSHREQLPRGRANNRNQSMAKPQFKQRSAHMSADDRLTLYEDDLNVGIRYRQSEERTLMKERKYTKDKKNKKDQQENYGQQNYNYARKDSRQDNRRMVPEDIASKENQKITVGGRYIEPSAAPKDKYNQRQRSSNKRSSHEHNMQSSIGNVGYETLTESIPKDTRFLHPYRYQRAREDDSEYAAILEDYAELYKIRITIPEEQVAMLSRELGSIKNQLLNIQGQIDDTFPSIIDYMEEGRRDVRQISSTIELLGTNIDEFCKNMDTRLRDVNEQMSANQLLLKAAPAFEQQQQQHNTDSFLEILDTHLKTSLASYLPACLQSPKKYHPLDGKVATDNIGNDCEATEPVTVSVRQLRAPLPPIDNSSVEEKYKLLEQKYNRALVTIKAMRLTTGLDCVPINTDADYLAFLKELESRTGPANSEFSKGRYMLRIRGANNDGDDAYVGILDVKSDNNILLRHRHLPGTLSADTSEQLKKDMVMRLNDMSYVAHEIYESLLPPPSVENE